MIVEQDGARPDIHPTAFVHETAVVIGRVKIGPNASIWPHAVLRGDIEEIVVGEGTNIQDGVVIHTDQGSPTILGKGISVGHSAVLHGCRVGNNCLIGMGSILLNNVVVEDESMVGAGALVSPNTRVLKGQLALGMPARMVRALKPEELDHIRKNAENYLTYMEKARSAVVI